jgi:hypothetical protein
MLHWSDVLGLWLTVDGSYLQARTKDGRVLLSPAQEAVARRHEATAHRQEAEARRVAEAEVARLLREIEQLKRGENT